MSEEADRAAAAKWADVVEAALNGDLPAVRGFVRQNRAAALSATNQKFGGITALMCAATRDHDDVVHFLIEAKADLDVANNDGRTALRWAARCGCLRSAGLLVAAGASLDVKDGDGETPLDDARSQGHDNVVKLLESAAEKQKEAEAAPISGADNPTERAASGAVKEDDAAAKDRMGPKIIEFAQLGHVTDLQEVLVDHPSAVHTTNDDGRTLLHLAALNRHVETVRALLSARAAVRVADSKGEMPLHCAAFGGRIEVVEYLLAARAMVHDASESGQTALQLAQIKGSKEVIAVLKSRAEDADKDQREKEVLDEADASKTKGEFPYDKLAEDALFLISGTTSLDAGTLRRINQEKKKIGEPELSTGTNAQELLNELEEEGFSVFGCGVGEEDAPLYRRIEVNVGLLKYNASKPLISDTDLRLKRGLGKTVDRQDRWLIHYKHYSEKTKYGVLILAGTVDFFRLWAASEACRREVEDVPDGRLFAYIDGYILRVNSPKCAQLWASNAAGIGYIVWSIGDLYVGSLRASKQHGRGKYFFQNGDTFDGYFRGGQMHGNNGMYSYVNGDKLEGTWADGKAVLAQCKYHVQDGKLFEGHWPAEYMDARNVQEYVSSCS